MRIPSDARWEEIDEQFVWKHRLSKSGTREGIMDLETGKTELFELLEFPLVQRPAPSSSARAPATTAGYQRDTHPNRDRQSPGRAPRTRGERHSEQ
jgi:hypothetical protein